jgi:hypothetical protein
MMKHYLTGFAIAMTVMVLLNLVPYVLSRGSYGTDGSEVAGFPFTFWCMGGVSFVREFKVQSLIADVAVALAASVVAGGLWMEHARQRPSLAIHLRFTIRDLLVVTALIAMSLCCVPYLASGPRHIWPYLPVFFGFCGAAGAGIFELFRKPFSPGLIVGLAIALLIFALSTPIWMF